MSDDPSTAISVIAALVSLLAAFYARWQASAAKRANEISLHENRMNIYKAVTRFRAQLVAHGSSLTEENVWQFSDAVEESEFYFSSTIKRQLQHVLDESMNVIIKNIELRNAREAGLTDIPSLLRLQKKLTGAIREECTKVIEDLKPLLRIGEA